MEGNLIMSVCFVAFVTVNNIATSSNIPLIALI